MTQAIYQKVGQATFELNTIESGIDVAPGKNNEHVL